MNKQQPGLFDKPKTGSYWKRPDRTPRMMREGADTWPAKIYVNDMHPGETEQLKEWGWTLVEAKARQTP